MPTTVAMMIGKPYLSDDDTVNCKILPVLISNNMIEENKSVSVWYN